MPVLEVIVHEARQLRTAARGVYVSARVDGTRESLEPQKSGIENETTNPSFGSANFEFSLDRDDLQYAELVIEVKADGVDRRSQMIGKAGIPLAKVNAAAMEKKPIRLNTSGLIRMTARMVAEGQSSSMDRGGSRSPRGGGRDDDKLETGTKIEARYRGKSRYYPGTISRARLNGTYDIDYDDGEKETNV